jgi:hypothetical protein
MWKNNEENGKGIEFFSDGLIYITEYKEGERKGKGILILSDGHVHFTQIKDEKIIIL